MRLQLRSLALLLSLWTLSEPAHPAPTLAASLRVTSSDNDGVTVQLVIGAWTLSAPGHDGRVHVVGLPDAHELAEPGRPMLPAWSATLALPNDARPSARVLTSEGEIARDGIQLTIAGRPGSTLDELQLGTQPTLEPVAAIIDGPWPRSSVQLAAPFGFRGRRLVQLEIRPFRYDAGTGRISAPLLLTIRLDFNRAGSGMAAPLMSSEPDRHVDPLLEASVLNWQQGSGWRGRPLTQGPRRWRSTERGGFATDAVNDFDESQPEVRVRLDETALYRLAADDLVVNGFPAGVPVADVSVHRHEFLENSDPPYATIELPVEIEDQNGNGTFDSGDGVWLWTRNWAERSHASNYRRWWGDAQVVYVTRKPGGGLRVAQRPGWNGISGLTPVHSYPHTQHYERDSAPFMAFVTSEVDTNLGLWQWTDLMHYYNRPDTIRITASDIDTTHAGSMTVRWVGRRSSTHVAWAALRNGRDSLTTVIDSVTWFGRSAVTRTSAFRGSALSEGDGNFYRQWGRSGPGPPDPVGNSFDQSGLDWFDLRYWRRFSAREEFVRFNSADAVGDIQMHVDNFGSDSVRVYDVTDPERPVRVIIDPAHISTSDNLAFDLQDTVSGARHEYVAASQLLPPDPTVGPMAPTRAAYSPVTRREVYANIAGDYLLVYPEAFASATVRLATLRRSQGLSVVEAPLESIEDEFGDGRHSAQGLQRFARYAYQHWNSRFLLLAGNGTLDPRNLRVSSGPDWIPVLPTPSPVSSIQGLEVIPSDNRYGFITGNDDPISSPDTNRVVPELMVGRLTGNNLAEIADIISKIIDYENLSISDAWRRGVVLTADDAFSGDNLFGGATATNGYCHRSVEEMFVGLSNTMQSFIQSDSGVAGMDVTSFNLRSYLTGQTTYFDPVTGDTCRVSRDSARDFTHAAVTPRLLGILNGGQLLWNFVGHANEYALTHEDLYLGGGKQDALRLRNDHKPFLFTSMSCHVNMFARPENEGRTFPGSCLGADLLALPNGRGAIGSWGSVSFEALPRNDHDNVVVELMRSLFVNPPRDELLGPRERGSRVVLGEVILATLFRYVGTTQSYASERGLAISFALLGDPATRMSIGRPFNQVTANGLPVTIGSPLRLHTAGDTLRIEADLTSNVRLDSLTLSRDFGLGETRLDTDEYRVTPAWPDTANGGSFGGRRFRLTYHTRPEARDVTYTVQVTDRNGLSERMSVSLQLASVLRSGGAPLREDDEVPPNAALSLLLLSPRPITNPTTDLVLTINGQPQAFTASPAQGDTISGGFHSRREWILSWARDSYPIDHYELRLSVDSGGSLTNRFRVSAASGKLALGNLIPFPNPFDESGMSFSFNLLGGEDADVKLHVLTSSGRSIFADVVHGLAPGYHQIAWNGKDSEGDELANGVYFFRFSATTASGAHTQQLGRLVKLRRPHHQ